LQAAPVFGEHMVVQRQKPVPVWGRSAGGDTVTVTLGAASAGAVCEDGVWKAVLPPMEACEAAELTIVSQMTGERISFHDVAVGEVWLAGGQSNMEFLLRYDQNAQEMFAAPDDPLLRYYRQPLTAFRGADEREAFPDDGFWRRWISENDRKFFSAAAAFMGRKLREALGVPVGFVGCCWGGTPAAAWTDLADIRENAALRPVLEWHREVCENLDWPSYIASLERLPLPPTPEMTEIMDYLMMGGDPSKIPGFGPPAPSPEYNPWTPGPAAAIRPGGLYENMLKKVAPFPVRGVIWYQGEDDDGRGWQRFYDESMKTLIGSWRKLWEEDLPFLQVELAPFEGTEFGNANDFALIREMQRKAADETAGVYNACIMDAGDRVNIHPRNKKPAGERLALLARRYVYGETDLLADSPRYRDASRTCCAVRLRFENSGGGLYLDGELGDALFVFADGAPVAPAVSASGDTLVLTHPSFERAGVIRISFAQQNYCRCPLFNSAGLPAFPFSAVIVQEETHDA